MHFDGHYCKHCVSACIDLQVWSTETIDRHGEGKVETCRADGQGVVKDGREAWTEGTRWPED
jgi:hypothetical protein